MPREYWLRCNVTPGQFSGEFAVAGRLFDGTGFSLFAPTDTVETDESPSEDRSVDGWIRVEKLECKKQLCLLRLPRETLENGQYITVNIDQLEARPARQEA